MILQCPPITGGRKIFSFIPTPNGLHIISPPFDLNKFKDLVSKHKLPLPDIHKNNPTILCYNKKRGVI